MKTCEQSKPNSEVFQFLVIIASTYADGELMENNTAVNSSHWQDVLTQRSLSTAYTMKCPERLLLDVVKMMITSLTRE